MNRRIPAALAALILGAGVGACGGDNESNEGEQLPEGSNTQIETDPGVTAAPTDTTPQPSVTQTEPPTETTE